VVGKGFGRGSVAKAPVEEDLDVVGDCDAGVYSGGERFAEYILFFRGGEE
jgi:hypothetical protein